MKCAAEDCKSLTAFNPPISKLLFFLRPPLRPRSSADSARTVALDDTKKIRVRSDNAPGVPSETRLQGQYCTRLSSRRVKAFPNQDGCEVAPAVFKLIQEFDRKIHQQDDFLIGTRMSLLEQRWHHPISSQSSLA